MRVALPDSPWQPTTTLPPITSGHSTGFVGSSESGALHGTVAALTGAVAVTVLAEQPSYGNTGHIELSVRAGVVRVYSAVKVSGFVVTPQMRRDAGYRYAEATPGHPASLTGEMITWPDGYGFVLEAVGTPAQGVEYRAWYLPECGR